MQFYKPLVKQNECKAVDHWQSGRPLSGDIYIYIYMYMWNANCKAVDRWHCKAVDRWHNMLRAKRQAASKAADRCRTDQVWYVHWESVCWFESEICPTHPLTLKPHSHTPSPGPHRHCSHLPPPTAENNPGLSRKVGWERGGEGGRSI